VVKLLKIETFWPIRPSRETVHDARAFVLQ
jgi:hypothetical protein